MSNGQTSSLLPPSGAPTAAELVAQATAREAERGERLVAWARALVLTGVFVVLTVEHGIPVLTGRAPDVSRGWIPLLLAPALLFAWCWLAVLRRVRYRAALGRASAVTDVLLLMLFQLVEIEVRGSSVAAAIVVGALPPLLALLFVLAAAGLRQDVAACVASGALATVGTVVVLARARAVLPPGALPPELARLGGVAPWVGRGMILAATTTMVALAARNARRMARSAGVAIGERSRITALFGRYVDPEIARAVVEREGAAAETREVTVLFTDLRDFTAMSERMEPAAVLEALNAHYEALVPVVHRHGGTVNKFIGDAIMATFGAPLPQPDHARRAVAAAAEMLVATDELNARRRRAGGVEFRMGVGVATGPVVVGTLGAADRVEYAVIGDTVNTASRLEGLCKELGVPLVIATATRAAVGDAMRFRSLGEVAVRGRSGRVEVFTLQSPSASAA